MLNINHVAKKQKGFTLIELLVVIAIIGILASIILVALNDKRIDARDSARLQELKQLENALEVYYSKHGVYPCGNANAGSAPSYPNTTADFSLNPPFLNGGNPPPSNCSGSPTYGLYGEGIISTEGLEDPINTIPYLYAYRVSNGRQVYVLYTHLERDTTSMQGDGGFCANYYEAGVGAGDLLPYVVSSGPGSMVSCN